MEAIFRDGQGSSMLEWDQPKQQTIVKSDQEVQVPSLPAVTCELLGQSLTHIVPQLPYLELTDVMKVK